MHKILILEDDLNLRTTIEDELKSMNYHVVGTDSSNDMLDICFANKFDLYLLDVNVVGMDGFTLLKSLRLSGDDTPAIYLTSRSTTKDVVMGFDAGGDDYIKKPFEIEELVARIKRFLEVQKCRKVDKDIIYYPDKYEIMHNGLRITLKQKEAAILEYFLEHPNRIITKEQILEDVYESEYITDSTFRGYINKIRKAVGKDNFRNIRGKGYIFEKA